MEFKKALYDKDRDSAIITATKILFMNQEKLATTIIIASAFILGILYVIRWLM